MSAFNVSPEHIALLACTVANTLPRFAGCELQLADLLADANAVAVAYRYEEEADDDAVHAAIGATEFYRQHGFAHVSAAEVAGAFACYHYQASELPGYNGGALQALLDETQDALPSVTPEERAGHWEFEETNRVVLAARAAA